MLSLIVLVNAVLRGPSGLHARQIGDVRAGMSACVIYASGMFRPLGAPGVHARLEGDVRAGSRLLSPHRLSIGFVVVLPVASSAFQLIMAPPAKPVTAMRSSLAVPMTLAIAIGSRG